MYNLNQFYSSNVLYNSSTDICIDNIYFYLYLLLSLLINNPMENDLLSRSLLSVLFFFSTKYLNHLVI